MSDEPDLTNPLRATFGHEHVCRCQDYKRLAEAASASRNDWDYIARMLDIQRCYSAARQIRDLAAALLALGEP